MKRIEFTLQFVILLAAMPLLVFMQFKHDYKISATQTQTEPETAYTKKLSVSENVFLSASRLVVN